MINPDLLCIDCDQYGYVAADAGDGDALLGAICHCCGHVLDKDEIGRRLKDFVAAKVSRGSRRAA